MQAGYPAINVKYGDRARYYRAFDVFARTGSPDAMVELVTSYVSEQLDQYLALLST